MLLRTAFFLGAAVLVPAAEGTDPSEFFEMRVRPVLAKNCFGCHTQTKMSGLDMSSRDGLMIGGRRGAALIARDPDGSLIIRAIQQSGELKMPPSGKLPDQEIADLAAWVKSGAVWPENQAKQTGGGYRITAEQRGWWAFQPAKMPALPPVRDEAWGQKPIDRFVLSRLEAKGLKPAAPASRPVLIRRAYYDLIGLPPTAEEVEAFVKDKSSDAFRTVVDTLLASPHYGERWGRYWLDVARYSDDRLNSTQDSPYENAWRYRDWVIEAFNRDLPYDTFVKAQLAGDQLPHPDREKLIAGTGFFALSPEFQDDRVDVASRGFLGLTVACAQCHDHKFDPIPQRDYYAMLGVFTNSSVSEYPLAPEAAVAEFKKRKERVDKQEKEIDQFLVRQGFDLAEIFAAQAAQYLSSARKKNADGLDRETFERWVAYLAKADREHPYLDGWEKPGFNDEDFQAKLLAVIAEKKRIDDVNHIRLGGSDARRDLASADLLSLPRNDYFLWRDIVSDTRPGVLFHKGTKLERFLSGEWKAHLERLRTNLAKFNKEMPEQYAFYHVMKDNDKPRNERLRIRGAQDNPGPEIARSFLSILSKGEPEPFQGGGRLELAERITAAENPLTARVMVNRIWQNHFGQPLVATPSNFGQLGEKPSHPALLDYLAARFVESGWSMKALHREIMMSKTYQLGNQRIEKNFTEDPDNRLFWRAGRRRLDIEPLRDTLLLVSGELDRKAGGPPVKITEATNTRRTVYGFVSRRKLDGTLALFDFPNPNNHSEQRIQTANPLQQLFFLNSTFVRDRARKFAARVADHGTTDEARIKAAYRLIYARPPVKAEIEAGLEYLRSGKDEAWIRYSQALLSANELLFVN
jgi:cytochrome c553